MDPLNPYGGNSTSWNRGDWRRSSQGQGEASISMLRRSKILQMTISMKRLEKGADAGRVGRRPHVQAHEAGQVRQ